MGAVILSLLQHEAEFLQMNVLLSIQKSCLQSIAYVNFYKQDHTVRHMLKLQAFMY